MPVTSRRQFSAERFKEARLARGLTQAEMAALLGKQMVTIRHYELGRRAPRTHELPMVADALRLKIDDLFTVPTAPQSRGNDGESNP